MKLVSFSYSCSPIVQWKEKKKRTTSSKLEKTNHRFIDASDWSDGYWHCAWVLFDCWSVIDSRLLTSQTVARSFLSEKISFAVEIVPMRTRIRRNFPRKSLMIFEKRSIVTNFDLLKHSNNLARHWSQSWAVRWLLATIHLDSFGY